jgi:hypothetical protein
VNRDMSAFESIAAEKVGEEYEVLFDWTPEVICPIIQ